MFIKLVHHATKVDVRHIDGYLRIDSRYIDLPRFWIKWQWKLELSLSLVCEGLQSGDPDRVSRANFFEKTPASRVEKGNLQISFFCVQGYWEILIFSRNERGNWRVTYISGGKSRLTLVHKFTNHARLSVKFTLHILIFSLNHASCVNPFTRMQT